MSWRQIVIENKCKAEYSAGFIIVKGVKEARIYLDEVDSIILASTACAITASLVVELAKRKIKLIFCDEKHNPCCESIPFYGNARASKLLQEQMLWSSETKSKVWQLITKEKITNQSKVLAFFGKDEASLMLAQYAKNVELWDSTNREGPAAKVYFNALFGLDFGRREPSAISAALNYGYAIILSAFNREIVAGGYSTEIGVFHCNEYNSFNLSCDFMEPYRQFADIYVKQTVADIFLPQQKLDLINILNQQVKINGQTNYIVNAIKITVRSLINALNHGDYNILFAELSGDSKGEL